jgi:hypothetical protein
MNSKIDKNFNDLYNIFYAILKDSFDKYTEIRKLFNERFSNNWSTDICSVRRHIDLLLSEIETTIMLHSAIDTLSTNYFVDVIIKNFKDSKSKIKIQEEIIVRLLKNINFDDLL